MSQINQSINHYIIPLEGALKAIAELEPGHSPDSWLLSLKLLYDGEPSGQTSFNLHGYSEPEAKELVQNIYRHEYIMREIDDLLFGDSDT